MHAFAVFPDLLANGGLIFSESGSDGSFCGTVFDSGFDDFSFLKRQSRLFIAVRTDNTSLFKEWNYYRTDCGGTHGAGLCSVVIHLEYPGRKRGTGSGNP
ncbi:MAG: hypothetical protein LUG56_07535 [Lachnospiraceae bacterium]|nr:hypothetical protein [Lachnospiraceae bacterium]